MQIVIPVVAAVVFCALFLFGLPWAAHYLGRYYRWCENRQNRRYR